MLDGVCDGYGFVQGLDNNYTLLGVIEDVNGDGKSLLIFSSLLVSSAVSL